MPLNKLAGLTPRVLTACSEFNRPFTNFFVNTMTTIRTDDPGDLLPSELDPWPPSDEEIQEREKQALFDDYIAGIPDAAERNRSLK